MGAADSLGVRFRKPEVLDLACLDQVLHRASYFLNGHVWIYTMLIEQINGIDFEPAERSLSNLLICSGRLSRPTLGSVHPWDRF